MGVCVKFCTNGATRWWITHLLLIGLLLRSLVPAGYMPDFSTTSDGGLKIVICTAIGVTALTVDDGGKPVPDQGRKHQDQPCAFAGIAAAPLPAMAPLETGTAAYERVAWAPRAGADLPPSRAGPPLGSRGPPIFS